MTKQKSWLDTIIPKVTLPAGRRGKWAISKVTIEDSPVMRFRERHFEPGEYTQLYCEGRGLIMSDTPAERYDHLGFVRAAAGHVLISGLGIGMCVGAVLLKKEVESVTVLEIEKDVIDLVAPHYRNPRLNVIQADARKWQPPRGVRFGAVWHDIWDNICADNLAEIRAFNRRYGRRAEWKGCWSHEQLRTH